MSKAARQRTARERLAEERMRQAQREKQRRALLISLSALVVVGLVVAIGVYVATKKDASNKALAAYNGALAPVSRDADQSIVMAKPGVSAPVLEIFEDFQCPICRDMEKTVGSLIKKLAAQGKAKVVYRPFHLFGQQPEPTRGNSFRATNAALCVPADKWVAYHDLLYKRQGKETDPGFSNDDLIAWGKEVGITDPAFAKCVTDEQKKQQVADGVAYAQSRGVSGTPTLFLNGQKLENDAVFDAKTLEALVTAAAKTAPAPATGSPAPAATPSATPAK